MKRNIILASLLLVVLFAGTSCKKDHNPPVITNTPATPPPSGFETGTYANGFENTIDLIDVYTGKVVGAGFISGAAFKFTEDGKNAELYYTAETQYMQAATKAVGTIAFDEGSTADEGSFTYYANSAHYNGYGTTRVNRNATKDELTNNLTSKYYYRMDGQWLRIQQNGPVTEYSKSFEIIQ